VIEGFESIEDALEASKTAPGYVLTAFGEPKDIREQYLALGRVYRLLCEERREETASAKALAELWMKGEMLPGMREAAEAVANALLCESQ
jgi:hypothetical protein